jgi:hypothetical protein
MEKIKRAKRGIGKLPSASSGLNGSPNGSLAPIDKCAVDKNAIPIGVPVEVDGRAFIRFPCKDGHYKFSSTRSGILEIEYTAPLSESHSKHKKAPTESRMVRPGGGMLRENSSGI